MLGIVALKKERESGCRTPVIEAVITWNSTRLCWDSDYVRSSEMATSTGVLKLSQQL